MDLFDRQAGNLSAMAGLGAQAGTVGQEELIHAAVSRKEAKMQQRVHSYTASVMGKIGHMMWADEFLELSGETEAIAGSGIMVESSWTPEHREGDFWQYNFDIIPGSTNYESTEAKVGKIERAMEKTSAIDVETNTTIEQRHIIDLSRIDNEQLAQLERVLEQSVTGTSKGREVPKVIEGVHEG